MSLAMQFAIGGKTKNGVRVGINLHAGGLIFMERATNTVVFIGAEPVGGQYLAYFQVVFEFFYFHVVDNLN